MATPEKNSATTPWLGLNRAVEGAKIEDTFFNENVDKIDSLSLEWPKHFN